MKALLLIFVRNPILGKVKTRLAATLGEKQALQVYKCLLQYTRKITNELESIDKCIYYADFLNEDDLWNDYNKRLQNQDLSLGERMKEAFEQGFEDDYEKIVIIGSDCLELSVSILENAFKELDHHETVIGPAKDGGYYLLGMNKFIPQLFENKKWSTDSVFLDTIEDLNQGKLRYSLLETLSDIDTEHDLNNIEWLSICGEFVKI